MSINPVGGSFEGRKKENSRNIDPTKFKEQVDKVQKTESIDPDARKKKKERGHSAETQEHAPAKNRSIYDHRKSGKERSFGRPMTSNIPSSTPELTDNRSLPHSYEFWQKTARKNSHSDQVHHQDNRSQETGKHPTGRKDSRDASSHPSNDKKTTRQRSAKTAKNTPQHKTSKAVIKDTGQDAGYNAEDAPFKEEDAPTESSLDQGAYAPNTFMQQKSSIDEDPKASAYEEIAAKNPAYQAPSSSKKNEQEEDPYPANLESPATYEKKPFSTKEEKPDVSIKKEKYLTSLAKDFSPVCPLDTDPHKKEGEHHTPFSMDTGNFPLTGVAVGASFEAISRVSIPQQWENVFTQIVGTAIVMQQNGLSRTEVILNSPAFQQSMFFGSSLILEKYASAPDSFNIQLIGSNHQQMNAFIEGISGLYQAFEQGRFSFRVGKIHASYDPERALFRRKDSASGDKDSDTSERRDR